MNKKRLYWLVFFIFCFSMMSNVQAQSEEYQNPETKYYLVIEDDASLLKENEIMQLKEKMIPLTEFGNILFKSVNQNSKSTKQFAHDYYYERFQTQSGSLFLVDMENRYLYIYSDGANYKVITNSKAEIITDNIYTYASKKEYYTCASEAFRQMNTLLMGEKIAEPMKHISNGLVAIALAFLINFMFVMIHSRKKSATKEEILETCDKKCIIKNITVVKDGQSRVYSPQSSDSGSSGFRGGRRWWPFQWRPVVIPVIQAILQVVVVATDFNGY